MFIDKTSRYIPQLLLLLSLVHTIAMSSLAEGTPGVCHLKQYFILRNPHSGLVLEGTSPYVRIQHYIGVDTQLWSLEYLPGGLVHIINKSNRFMWFILAIAFSSCEKPFHPEDEYFIIRNPASGHVLEASNDFVNLQLFTGFKSQQWRLEPVRGGLHYIINRGTEKVMDLDYGSLLNKTKILIRERTTSSVSCPTKEQVNVGACQKWYIQYGGVIVNVCGKYALDIQGGLNLPGDSLQTFPLHEKDNQKFIFQYL